MNGAVIALHGLTKTFQGVTAVDDVSLEIGEGSICGLLGPNGAGKTTTFKCLLGFARPSGGSITIAGGPPRPEMFESLAYVAERAVLYERFTVEDHLALQRRSYRAYDEARARELLALFTLDPGKRARTLSKGMQTALSLVLAFSIRPHPDPRRAVERARSGPPTSRPRPDDRRGGQRCDGRLLVAPSRTGRTCRGSRRDPQTRQAGRRSRAR